ncbi:nuclease-related domain-containing protein [Luteimonas lutimaris]|uniref:NERD domain-containing protein n=1 Tax=Luteimonas lutimaris TaxID=698645 RepID=A0ABP7MIF2_9GAMM
MTGNLVMIGAFVLSVALMLAASIAVKYWRRRDTRRSPLHGKKLANLPGQQLVGRMNDHSDELLLASIVMYFSFPVMLLAWAMSRVQWETVQLRTMDWLFVIGAIAMFAYGLRRFVVHWGAKTRARDGLVAEQMTGQLLNRLIGPNCIVAHDLPCEGFNIDHIVIAPRAVYAVETKSFRKPRGSSDDSHYKVTFDGEALRFPDWRDDAPVIQARRQAQWLARYLRESLGREIPVIPAIALPGWWIDRTEESKRSDVRVFTPMGKGADFLLTGQEVLDDSTRTLVAQAIALRYPAIED